MADWAKIFKALYPAYMHSKRWMHASIANHAVEEVDSQSFPQSTQITIWTVENLPVHDPVYVRLASIGKLQLIEVLM